jgi:hypothetical protein
MDVSRSRGLIAPRDSRRRRRQTILSCVLTLTSLFVAACGGDPEAPTPPPAPAQQQDVLGPVSTASRLYSDNAGGFTDSTRIVVRDEEEWNGVWERATSHRANTVPRPAVDFTEYMVVVVAAGRMTPEDQIRVDSVGVRSVRNESGDLEDVYEIVVRTTEGCGRLRVDAFPFEIIRTSLFEGPVRFVERRTALEGCRHAP